MMLWAQRSKSTEGTSIKKKLRACAQSTIDHSISYLFSRTQIRILNGEMGRKSSIGNWS